MISTLTMQHPDELRRLELLRLSHRNHLPMHLTGAFGLPPSQGTPFQRGPIANLNAQLSGQSFFYPGASLPQLISGSGMLQNHLSLASTRRMLEASNRGLSYFSSLASGLPTSHLSFNSPTDSKLALSSILRGDIGVTAKPQEPATKLPEATDHHRKSTPNVEVLYNPEGALLREDFEPGQYSVIIGRTKKCYTSVGNLRLRDLCLMHLPTYSKCSKKKDKSQVVSEIMQLVRESCPDGGAFIKKDDAGRWHEVREVIARERVASIFRDFLHDQYRSSSKSKVEKRREKRVKKVLDSDVISSGEESGDES